MISIGSKWGSRAKRKVARWRRPSAHGPRLRIAVKRWTQQLVKTSAKPSRRTDLNLISRMMFNGQSRPVWTDSRPQVPWSLRYFKYSHSPAPALTITIEPSFTSAQRFLFVFLPAVSSDNWSYYRFLSHSKQHDLQTFIKIMK